MNRDYEKEIESYQRILERERKARNIAETQLEDNSREIYQTSVLLKEQTKQAQIKQRHLAFLSSVAEDNWKSESVKEVIEHYLKKSCVFLGSPSSVYFQIEKDLSLSRLQVAKITTAGDEDSKTVSSKEIHIALGQMDMQKIKDDFSDRNKGGLFSTLDYCKEEGKCNLDIQVYLMPIVDSQGKKFNKLSCMCFFYRSYDDVDLIKLQTLEASHSIFSVAIERKKAEAALKTKLDELQQRNEELQQIQQQLIESEKLASLGQLSAGVAHEINNPVGFVLSNLTTMVGYMEELAEAMAPLGDKELGAVAKLSQWQQKSQEYETDYLLEDSAAILKSSINGLERVKTIVSDLGSFARMDTDELTEVDINQVIHSSLNILNNELKYDHKVVLDLQPHLAILGNDGQLQQVFINFFVNAKHAMPDGGHLWITSKKVRERVVVSIKDEGHGIPPEKVKEIFTPFFTTKPPGEGTGLGLSISYSILQRHHAKIKVNSVVDEGTEFLLSFVPSH